MKFKYIGQSGRKNLDLAIYGVVSPAHILITGEIITVPDDHADLIERIKINGNFEEYNEPKKVIKPKKTKKETKKEEKEDK